jgi:antitoxin (DNA-binding transcriptional repressor) of toxin-antitoxin stability system
VKIPISTARQKRPLLVKQLQKHQGDAYEITVRNEVIAHLTAAPVVEPGLAPTSLLALRDRWEDQPDKHPLPDGAVSEHRSVYLYGENLVKKRMVSQPWDGGPSRPASRLRSHSS